MKPVLLSALAACCLVGCGKIPKPSQVTTSSQTAIYSRSEFDAMVIGKTQEQVKAAVGTPDSTSRNGNSTCWYYRRRTRDEVTNKIDTSAQVVWQNDVVSKVNY